LTARTAEHRRIRLVGEWLAVCLAAVALLVALVFGDGSKRFDDAWYALILRFRTAPAPANIIIVAIDEHSLERIGRWPWTRATQARLVRRIAEAGPKAIGYDLLLAEPSNPGDDAALAQAFKATPVFAPVQPTPGSNGAAVAVLQPPPPIGTALAGSGETDADFDADGVMRRVFLSESDGQRLWPHLMWIMAKQAGGRPPPTLKGPSARGFGLARGDEVLIPFIGPPGSIRQIPAAEVLAGALPPAFLRDQIVLVGATAGGLADAFPTPTSGTGSMPGVEIHANLLNGLLTGQMIRAAPKGVAFAVSLILTAVFLAGLLFAPPRRSLLLGFVLAVALTAGSAAALIWGGYWLSPVPGVITLAFILPVWGWRRLHAASLYLAHELEGLQAGLDHPVPPRVGGGLPTDLVERQIDLLQRATQRTADLRRFVSDVIAQLPEAAMAVDQAGAVLLANQAAHAMARDLGVRLEPGAFVGHLLDKLRPNRVERALWPPPSDARLAAAGPADRQFEIAYAPWHDADGGARGWVIDISDVTQLTGALRQREEALQLFSHDLRSPQAAILALLERPEMTSAPEPIKARIAGHARRSLALAEGFVQLARAQGAEYRFEVADVAHLLTDAADELWAAAQAKGVTIRLDLPEDEALARVDRALMTRVLINLLDNAVKYSPADGAVAAGVTLADDQVRCTVADQGPGLGEDQVGNLFTRFASQGGLAQNRTGSGLGLAFCHRVVLRHSGAIRCESRPGEGALFIIELPRVAAD
jgi:CHASE2 domain-containing sensor protein/signal transduction histidine kinase